MYLISRQRSCLNVYTVICSCSYGSSACRTSQFICPLSCLTTHTVAACISVCFFMRNGDKEAERKSVWVCVRARSCISASPRVCILVFKLTHPDTALQRLDPHVNVCHLKLLIFQRWLIFFLPLAVMRSLWVLNIPLIELICSLLPHVISVQLLKCLMRSRSWPFMSASRKLIINEDLTALLCAWQLPTTVHMHSICSIYNTRATYVFHCTRCALRFKTVSTNRQFHSNCLFIQAMNVSIRLLFTRVRSRVQAQHVLSVLTVHREGCLRAPRQAVQPDPPLPYALFWYNTSGSYPDPLL